jgi:hypothetical protein
MHDFECHITVKNEPRKFRPTQLRRLGREQGWSFSHIADDPVLGPGTFQYLTRHNNSPTGEALNVEMRMMVATLRDEGFKVIRAKIEMTVLDERY